MEKSEKQLREEAYKEALTTARESQQERLKVAPVTWRPILERVYAGKGTLGQRVKLNCLQCVGYVKEDVACCVMTACTFWPIRPFQTEGLVGHNLQKPPSEAQMRARAAFTERARAAMKARKPKTERETA